MTEYLVVAHQTADSDELVEAVRKLARQEEDSGFWLVVPATPVDHLLTWTEGEGEALAAEQADRAKKALEAAGATVLGTEVGDANPVDAARDALRQQSFDAIVISTLPATISRWLRMDAVHRLEREVDLPMIHVVADSKGDG